MIYVYSIVAILGIAFFLFNMYMDNDSSIPNIIDIQNTKVINLSNVPQGLNARIQTKTGEFLIEGNGFSERVPYKYLVDSSVEKVSDISSGNFSMKNALIGTALVGGIGAIAGFNSNKNSNAIVISYLKDGNIDYIILAHKNKNLLNRLNIIIKQLINRNK